MRITKLFLALAIGLALVGCETTSEPSSEQQPNFEVLANEWYPFTWHGWACDEPVLIDGRAARLAPVTEVPLGQRFHIA